MEPNLKTGIQQLRFNHYENKRKLKLKAIENLVKKSQKQGTEAGRQIS